ncbi:hypothetical protein VTN31DRAFT_42 [Thermomyces dupontii]|uniref:uncharacterized protein n=1 Tax=Talaromyces thermophilus TaxID=28565 RepID=UPI0037436422
MTSKDRIYVNTGVYRLGGESGGLNAFEKASIENLTKAGKGSLQYLLDDAAEVERARNDGHGHAIDPFRLATGGKHAGYLDMVGGFVYADKACRYALHKARALGVKFVLDDVAGRFRSFKEDVNGRVTGIATDDGRTHPAAVVVVAWGAWTPSILPEIDGLCEATAGSIALIQIPPIPRLRQRFSPENFPVWHYRVGGGESGDVYGFPIDERGVMKIGYRGTKYTTHGKSMALVESRACPSPAGPSRRLTSSRINRSGLSAMLSERTCRSFGRTPSTSPPPGSAGTRTRSTTTSSSMSCRTGLALSWPPEAAAMRSSSCPCWAGSSRIASRARSLIRSWSSGDGVVSRTARNLLMCLARAAAVQRPWPMSR